MGEPGSERHFAELIQHLKDTNGSDFSDYREPSLRRRVQRRLSAVQVQTYEEYLDYLQVHPVEYTALLDSILINVTSFFRDRDTWDHVAKDVLPALLASKGPDDPIRVWSVGCASGQEAYSLCMLLAEAMPPERFREQVKIYATDLDEGGLTYARHAHYLPREMKGVPADLAERYFVRGPTGYTFRSDLRGSVVFGRHDVVRDAPISRLDLLLCRNTLMYFNRQLQSRVLEQFRFALEDSGLLLLGRAEMLLSHADLFVPLSLKHRVFRKAPRAASRRGGNASIDGAWSHPLEADARTTSLRDAVLGSSPPTIAIGAEGDLVLANPEARSLLGITASEMGKPLRDLEISHRPLDLRSIVGQVREQRRRASICDFPWPDSADAPRYFDVTATPLLDERGRYLGTSVRFLDTTSARSLRDEVERARRELGAATADALTMRAEWVSTAEELQCTIEELETTNEELQSSNEELETMNEELQSANEELETMNEELRERSAQIVRTKAFLESILSSVDVGVVVIDRDHRVHVWNDHAAEMWGLREDEVTGRDLRTLDFGLPMDHVGGELLAALEYEAMGRQAVIQATNRRGRGISCRLTFSPMRVSDDHVVGVVLVMSEGPQAEANA